MQKLKIGNVEFLLYLALVSFGILAVTAVVGSVGASQAPTSTTVPEPEPEMCGDVHRFQQRAQRWGDTRRQERESALRRAEALAASTRAAMAAAKKYVHLGMGVAEATVRPALPEGTTEDQWHALRQCESSQNYQAVSPTGRYRGAYQFWAQTWDWIADMYYPHLVGVDPINASMSDQDQMAHRLYKIAGWDPWPTCKKVLPAA